MEYESNQCPERLSEFPLNLLTTTRLAKLKAFCEKYDCPILHGLRITYYDRHHNTLSENGYLQ